MTPDKFCFKQCCSVSTQLHPRLDSHPLKHLYTHEDKCELFSTRNFKVGENKGQRG